MHNILEALAFLSADGQNATVTDTPLQF